MAQPANNNRKHDIRNAIPLTKMTNPADFPMHVHHDYPMMLTCYEELPSGKKKIVPVQDDVGQPVIVSSEGELETYLDNIEPEIADEIRSLLPRSAEDRDAETNAAMAKMAADNKALLARLAKYEGKSVDKDEPSNALAGVTTPTRLKPKVKPNKSLPSALKAAQ